MLTRSFYLFSDEKPSKERRKKRKQKLNSWEKLNFFLNQNICKVTINEQFASFQLFVLFLILTLDLTIKLSLSNYSPTLGSNVNTTSCAHWVDIEDSENEKYKVKYYMKNYQINRTGNISHIFLLFVCLYYPVHQAFMINAYKHFPYGQYKNVTV